jgi:septal ring factor EnvC (AmiA/AmiB activator)
VQEKIIASASRGLRDTQSALSTLGKDISSLNASIDKLQKQQKSQEAILAKQLDAAFRLGQHNGLQLIFSGEESERSERILAYFGYLNEARKKSIEELKQTRTDLASQRVTLQSKQTQQKSVLNEQQTQQQKLEQARAARKQTLTALESSLQKDEQSLTELRANETRLRDKIAAAERAARARAEKEAKEAAAVRAKEQQARICGMCVDLCCTASANSCRVSYAGKASSFQPVKAAK